MIERQGGGAEVKAKIEHRRDVYRKIAGGQDELCMGRAM